MIFLDFPAKSAVFWRGRTYKHSCRWARDTGQRHATKSGYEHTDRQGAKKKSQKVHKWLGSWMISPNPWISMRYVEVIAIITYNPLPCNILSFNRTSKQSEKWSTWQHGNKPTLKKKCFVSFTLLPIDTIATWITGQVLCRHTILSRKWCPSGNVKPSVDLLKTHRGRKQWKDVKSIKWFAFLFGTSDV